MCFVDREAAGLGDSAHSGDPALSGNLASSGDTAGSGLKRAGGVFFATIAANLGVFPAFAGSPVGLLFTCEYVLTGGPVGWLSSLGTTFLAGTGVLFSGGVGLLGVVVGSLLFLDDELGGDRGTEKQTNKQLNNLESKQTKKTPECQQ